jgi:glycosyltransferase involved in cell wall biosynthesis
VTARRYILALSPWPTARSMEGGGTPVLFDLLESLVAGGNEVHLVLVEGDEPARVPAGVVVHRTAPRRTTRWWMTRQLAQAAFTVRLFVLAVRLGRRLEELRAVYGLSALTIPAAAAAARVLRRPSVGHLFGTFLHASLDSVRGRWLMLEEWIAFKTPVDRLVVLDDGTQGDVVARRLGVPAARFRFWMHGLDVDALDAAIATPDIRSELGLPVDRPIVLSTSRLASWKRVDRVIDAFAAVHAQRPDALLVIAGDGPEEPGLRAHVAQSDLRDAVVFTGPLSSDRNQRLIAAADVACFLYEVSNVGVALLEALALGTAVVAGDTGATSAYIANGETGLIVREDDRSAAAAAIHRLLDDDDLRQRLGSAARRRTRASFLSKADRRRLELELLDELSFHTTAPFDL